MRLAGLWIDLAARMALFYIIPIISKEFNPELRQP